MNSKSDEKIPGARKTALVHGGAPNWIVIACGALLGTLSVRFGCKLKQVLLNKQTNGSTNTLRGHTRRNSKKSGACSLQSHTSCSRHEESDCCHFISETTLAHCGPLPRHADMPGCELALVASAQAEVAEPRERELPAIWASSTEHIELPRGSFHQNTGLDSPCVSESGSDIFSSKREVMHKLRQQLKKRDEMILEMQARISEQQKIMNDHARHAAHLQSLLDVANEDLLATEREFQQLRKVISDNYASGDCGSHHDLGTSGNRQLDNDYVNGVVVAEVETMRSAVGMPASHDREAQGGRVAMLKREVAELRDVMEGKDYLLQSYKEEKMELSLKVKELQLRLDAQLLNIL